MNILQKPLAILVDTGQSMKVIPLSSILYLEDTVDGYDIILTNKFPSGQEIRIQTKSGLNEIKKYFTILNP